MGHGGQARVHGRYAPLAVFAYRRLDSLMKVLDALEACAEFADTEVIVFSDGPKGEHDAPDIAAVRTAMRQRLKPNMRLVEQTRNRGLAPSIIEGVSDLCEKHGRVIVFEDDHVAASGALAWFNAALDAYADAPHVMSVGGIMYDVPAIARANRAVFMWHPTPTSWAVWKRSWSGFDPICADWLEKLRDSAFRERFLVGGAMPFLRMLREEKAGRSSSWAIRWQYAVAKAAGLVVYPPRPMVQELGDDGLATHGQRTAFLLPTAPLWASPEPPPLPEVAKIDQWAVDAWIRRLRWSAYGAAVFLSDLRYRFSHGPLPRPKPLHD